MSLETGAGRSLGGLVVAAVALCGCLIEVDYGGTRFSCAVDGICPAGLECVDDLCVPPTDARPVERLGLTVTADVAVLENIPVMVALTPERIDYSRAAPDGSDIRFVGPFDGEELAHEIERWDPTGTSIVWVKMPSLATGEGFTMMYGGGVPAGQRPEELWSAYQAVFHLDSDGAESSNGIDATGQGGVSFTAQMIGGAADFDGVDDHLTIDATSLMRAAGGATLSLWVRPAVTPTVGAVFEITNGTDDGTRLFLNINDNTPTWGVRTQDGALSAAMVIGPAAIATDTWSLLTATFDLASQSGVIYIDGVEVARSDSLAVDPATPDTDSTGAVIGADDSLENLFTGSLDEVRFTDVAFDAGWVEAQYLSMTDALLSYERFASP